ncbi:YueI family protein [Metabacillus halosaccharovorans]|uniref:YueI family protein n=1 Tax=Metabacillus halosaccharovorans TaxID=930124 RepID=UPI000994B156|nr:YueI family protein [Metabacillus halosaccharovorans]
MDRLDEYIQQGIHGPREINPDERKKFLGTLRERVVVVLTKSQVREPGTYKEVEYLMQNNKQATLFLNGNMNYSYLSDYIKLANKVGNKFSLSTNKEHDSDLGLVLAYDHAVNIEDIYISKQEKTEQKEKEEHNENSVIRFFKKLF